MADKVVSEKKTLIRASADFETGRSVLVVKVVGQSAAKRQVETTNRIINLDDSKMEHLQKLLDSWI